MKRVLYILIFILLLGATESGGPVAYSACVAACAVGACIFGICPFCPGVCAPFVACYDDNTTMETKSGVKLIADVEEGEPVLTIKDGKEHWSEVTLNMNIQVPAAGIYVEASDTTSGEEYKLHVTANHNVPSINALEDALALDTILRGADAKNSYEDNAKIVAA